MRYGLNRDWHPRGAGPFFPAQSSVLDEEALLSLVLPDYAIPPPDSCRFLTRGAADIYRIEAAAANFYLKIYRPPQSLQQTEAEARYVTALAASDIPVVKPIPRRDGQFAFQVSAPEGTRPMLLFEEAPPPLPTPLDETLLAQIGEQLAKVHAASDAFNADFGTPEMVSDAYLEERVYYASRYLSDRDAAYLGDVSRRLGHILRGLSRETPGFGLCHADLVLSNVRITAGGTIVFFDFENASKTWRLFDLACIYWSLGHRSQDRRDQLWTGLLAGYESIRPLPEAWSTQLIYMLILRQISFLGGNCATLPLRLGREPLESGFMEAQMKRLGRLVELSGILGNP